jgi:hypothetical protein
MRKFCLVAKEDNRLTRPDRRACRRRCRAGFYERGMTMETRLENLLTFLGWQGGTIHQVAECVGVPVETLLREEAPCLSDGKSATQKYNAGKTAGQVCSYFMRQELAHKMKRNKFFWIGVAETI